jgi:hypothetical protein
MHVRGCTVERSRVPASARKIGVPLPRQGLECYDSTGKPIPQYVAMMSRTYAQVQRACLLAGCPATRCAE